MLLGAEAVAKKLRPFSLEKWGAGKKGCTTVNEHLLADGLGRSFTLGSAVSYLLEMLTSAGPEELNGRCRNESEW